MSPAPARVDELKKRYEENPRRFFAPLANEYRKAGDHAAAIDLCRMHLEEQPGHLSGHIVYGQALYESARPDDARKAFEAALTLDPENLIALRHLGDIAKADGDAVSATHWYQRVLDADPRNDEVIALIDSLKQVPAASTVVIAEPEEAPPPPQYATDAPASMDASHVVDPRAPTPVIPVATVEPPTMRPSTGLLDLDLNLSDSTAPTVDLLSGMGEMPTPAADDLMPSLDESLPEMAEPAPVFEEGFPIGDATLPGASGDAPEFLGAEDTNLGLAGADTPLEVHDTMFDVEGPTEPESTFAATSADVAFGDSLDVTASEEFGTATPTAGPLDALPMLDVSDRGPIVEPITSISALSAPPAAPTASDFDMLFGSTPMGDVTVGGDSAPAGADEAGFIADAFIGREPSDSMLAGAADSATPPSPFVTETMAELYLQQGFRDEALDVYRQLLAQNPSDAGLAERVRHLEHGTRSSMALDSVSQEIEAAAEAEELRLSGSIPTVPAEPVEPLEGAVPAFMVDAPASAPVPPVEEVLAETAPFEPMELGAPAAYESAPAIDEAAPVAYEPEPAAYEAAPVAYEPEPVAYEPAPVADEPEPAATAPVPTGPSARDILARIASRRAVPGGGFAAPETGLTEAAPAAPTAPVEPAFDEAAASHAAPGFEAAVSESPSSTPIAPGGAVDRLFGMGGVIAVDEGAAVAMASAFGGAMAAPIRGEPTRKGTDELSLSSVFRSEAPAGAPSGVQRQSTKLRFDQFFAAAEDSSSAAPSTPAAPAPGRGEEDIAQFNDWLKGLKGK